MNSNLKTIIFWAVLICVAVLLWAVVKSGHGKPDKALNFSEFLTEVEAGNIKSVSLNGSSVKGDFVSGGTAFHTEVPANYPKLYDMLSDKKVQMTFESSNSNGWVSILVNASPFLLLFGFWIFMMRQMQSGGNKALSFGKSRARLHSTQQKKVTFKDVAGVEEAKEELQEIIEFLREPQNSRSSADAFRRACC